MENRVIKVLMLTGILCVTGITLCACQGIRQVSDESQNQEEAGKVNSEDNAVDNMLWRHRQAMMIPNLTRLGLHTMIIQCL